MKNLNNVISTKQSTLNSLQQEKDHLHETMGNPTLINENEQRIQDTRRSIHLLKDAGELASEKGLKDANTREKLESLIEELEEAKQDHEVLKDKIYTNKDSKVLETLNQDIKLLTSMINEDIKESSNSSAQNVETSSTSSNQENLSTNKSETSTDIDLPDYSSFDDF